MCPDCANKAIGEIKELLKRAPSIRFTWDIQKAITGSTEEE
jgi:hypothetical protein